MEQHKDRFLLPFQWLSLKWLWSRLLLRIFYLFWFFFSRQMLGSLSMLEIPEKAMQNSFKEAAHRWAWSKTPCLLGRLISLSIQQLFSIQVQSAHRESLSLPAKSLSLYYLFPAAFYLTEADGLFGMDSDRSIVIPVFLGAKVSRRTGSDFDTYTILLRNRLRACPWYDVLFHPTDQLLAGRNLLFWDILINFHSFLVWRGGWGWCYFVCFFFLVEDH